MESPESNVLLVVEFPKGDQNNGEYDNSLRKGKMAYAEHEQLEVELANQHKNTINAKINAEKTEKYLENVKNDELNNERIKLMTEELKSKEQSDNNLRQIELHKRLKKINEKGKGY